MALSLDELLKAPSDPTYYLSYPLIPKGGRILIGAPAKHFKSMLALNLCYDLAEASPLLGLKKSDGNPLWEVKRPLRILYCEAEIGKHRLKERMERIQQARGGEVAPDNFVFEPKGSGILLDNEIGLAMLKKRIEEVEPDVLVIDPLRKFHTQEEDSSTAMIQIVHSLDRLQIEFGLTTILVHHTAKRNEFRNPTEPESLRGSGLMFDDADTAIMLTRPVKTDPTHLQLNIALRSAADPLPLHVFFDEDTHTFIRREQR